MQVMTRPVVERWRERRSYVRGPEGSDGYSETIKAIEAAALRHMQLHDEKFGVRSNSVVVGGAVYVPNYSLANHNMGGSIVGARTTAWWSHLFAPRDIAIERTSMRLHDFGKTIRKNGFYREPRPLTYDELLRKNDHAGEGADFLWRYVKRHYLLTADEENFLMDVLCIVRYHHYPEFVEDPRLRSLTVIAKCADAFVSLQEDRPERPGLSPEVALGILRKDIATHSSYAPIRREAEQIADTLEKIYVAVPTQKEVTEFKSD